MFLHLFFVLLHTQIHLTAHIMRKTILLTILFATIFCLASQAQEVTPSVTVYKEFRPATVYLTSGKKAKIQLANIFLKNSSLLYMQNNTAMEAIMNTINRVEFEDRTYYRLDTILAYRVESVDNNVLYCAQTIDVAAFQQQRRNNVNISNLDLGEIIGVTTVDIGDVTEFPIKSEFFFLLDGKLVKVHERTLKLVLNKEQRRLMASVMNMPGFSWTDPKSLTTLLKTLTNNGK